MALEAASHPRHFGSRQQKSCALLWHMRTKGAQHGAALRRPAVAGPENLYANRRACPDLPDARPGARARPPDEPIDRRCSMKSTKT